MKRYNIWEDGELVADDETDFSKIKSLIEQDILSVRANCDMTLDFSNYEVEVIETFNATEFI